MAKKKAPQKRQSVISKDQRQKMDLFDGDFALGEKKISIDERRAVFTYTVTAKDPFPRGYEAADTYVEIDLSSLPPQTTIAQHDASGETSRKGVGKSTGWLRIGPRKTFDQALQSEDYKIELKTGFFAALELSKIPINNLTSDVVATEPKYAPASKSIKPEALRVRIAYEWRQTSKAKDKKMQDASEQDQITFSIID